MGRIRILPDAVVNKIAAGEVVERPASVLKELIENALDAGAGRIDVAADGGGRALIRVTDDGSGMAADDALLAFDRHATSKLGSVEDLSGIGTMGFRGEALPSIASVSRTTLTTRREGDLAGTVVVIEGGRVRSSGEGGARAGTTVEVRDLFFNVPARRAFLRSPATESARLQETFLEEALCRPDVAFSLTMDGKRTDVLRPAADRAARARDLLGEEYTSRMAHVGGGAGPVSVEGLVSRPGFDFSGWDHLHTVVNGRPVRSPLLIKAIGQAYAPYGAPGRKPAAVLWIILPGESLDVNVHPTKREVRFRNGGAVADAVGDALRGALGDRGAVAGRSDAAWPRTAPGGACPSGEGGEGGVAPTAARPSAGSAWQGDLGWLPAASAGAGAAPFGGTIDLSPVQDLFLFQAGFRVIGQWGGTYLIVEAGEALYLIDQHVAHERLHFEKYRRELSHHIASQHLLVPIAVPVPPSRLHLLEGIGGWLERLGIEAEPSGPSSVVVRSIPAGIPAEEVEGVVRDLLALVPEDGSPGDPAFLDAAAARLACSAAIKAGTPLSPTDARELLERLAAADNPYRCPHGRPVIVSLPRRAIDRAFGRG